MVSLDDFPTLNEVLEENQKTRDRSPTIKFLEKFSQFSGGVHSETNIFICE